MPFRRLRHGVILGLTLLLGCGAVTGPAPVLPGNPGEPGSPCPRPARPSFYSSQMLFGADIQDGTHLLWAYRIDNQTGALQEMPWSPLPTARGPKVGAADFQGHFLYLGSAGFGNPPRLIEAYELSAQDAAPVQLQTQEFGFPGGIDFDPTGAHLYALDPVGVPRGFAVRCDGTIEELPPPPNIPPIANSFGFKGDSTAQFALVTREDFQDQNANSLHVFRRDSSTGLLTEASSSAFTNTAARFLAVPESGRFFLGTKCTGQNFGGQVFSFEAQTGTVTALPDGFYPGICWAFFDRSARYVATIEKVDPQNQFSTSKVLAVYRLDQSTAELLETHREVLPHTASRVEFDLNNRYLYVSVNTVPTSIHAFAFDVSTGILTPMPGSPFAVPKLFRPMFIVGRP
jgi:hypothetical protein